jgi:hypothetical protein
MCRGGDAPYGSSMVLELPSSLTFEDCLRTRLRGGRGRAVLPNGRAFAAQRVEQLAVSCERWPLYHEPCVAHSLG